MALIKKTKSIEVCLIKGLHRLQQEDRYTDMTLVKGDKSYKLHRIVSCAASAYCNERSSKTCITIDKTEADIEILLPILYAMSPITLETFKKQIKPAAAALEIGFITALKPKLIKSDDHLNMVLRKLWLETFLNFVRTCDGTSRFCDVVLKVDSKEFHCHKVILAAVSQYFDSMFLSGMCETDAQCIQLHGVDKDLFKEIISFIYRGTYIINVQNIENVLSTSIYLQISCLQDLCEKFLYRNIDVENVVGILRLCDMYSLRDLKRKVILFIVHNFHRVVRTTDFGSISTEDLKEIIKHEQLCVKDETNLFDSVVEWYKTNKISQECLLELLNHIVLTEVASTSISKAQTLLQKRKAPENLKSLLESALNNREATNTLSLTSKSRKEEVLYVLRANGYGPGVYASCYIFSQKLWYKLPSLPDYNAGSACAACTHDSKIFLSGGSGNPLGFKSFDIETNKWSPLPNLPEERSEHAIAAVGDHIYIFGGRTQLYSIQSSIQRFDIKNHSWKRCGDMHPPLFGVATAVLDNKILLCGGCFSFGEYSDAIQSFDTTTNQCTTIARLPIPCSFMATTVHENVVYIVSPRGQVLKFEEDEDPLVIGNVHSSSSLEFSATFYRGDILVLGGPSRRKDSEEIIVFNVATGKPSTHVFKLPWGKMTNQYYGMITHINRSVLTKPYK